MISRYYYVEFRFKPSKTISMSNIYENFKIHFRNHGFNRVASTDFKEWKNEALLMARTSQEKDAVAIEALMKKVILQLGGRLYRDDR